MNPIKITSLAFITVLTIAACHSSKKSTTSSSTASSEPAPATSSTPAATSTIAAGPVAPAKAANGVYMPGDAELTAALTKYPDASLPVLAQGYEVYVGEACTACHHKPKGIYRIPEEKWPAIIDDMAHKASITAAQKDALTKYVFSIKATQPPPAAK